MLHFLCVQRIYEGMVLEMCPKKLHRITLSESTLYFIAGEFCIE